MSLALPTSQAPAYYRARVGFLDALADEMQTCGLSGQPIPLADVGMTVADAALWLIGKAENEEWEAGVRAHEIVDLPCQNAAGTCEAIETWLRRKK